MTNSMHKEILIDELKKIQLDILLDIHKFCEEKGIKYFLTHGTLLGAIRHKGYIPWDDDIDICMTRPNYMRFLKEFNGFYPHLQVNAPELDWNYYAPYANVYDTRTILRERADYKGIDVGIKIDVFPIDGVAEEEVLYQKDKMQTKHLWALLFKKRHKMWTKAMLNPLDILKFLNDWKYFIECKSNSFSKIQKQIFHIATQYKYEDCKYADKMTFPTAGFIRLPRNTFEEYIEVEFEGYFFKTIKDYDIYLNKLYGDYMKLPPIEKRVPHHDFTAFWK